MRPKINDHVIKKTFSRYNETQTAIYDKLKLKIPLQLQAIDFFYENKYLMMFNYVLIEKADLKELSFCYYDI